MSSPKGKAVASAPPAQFVQSHVESSAQTEFSDYNADVEESDKEQSDEECLDECYPDSLDFDGDYEPPEEPATNPDIFIPNTTSSPSLRRPTSFFTPMPHPNNLGLALPDPDVPLPSVEIPGFDDEVLPEALAENIEDRMEDNKLCSGDEHLPNTDDEQTIGHLERDRSISYGEIRRKRLKYYQCASPMRNTK
ncbi:hypothetical protein EG329_004045 [Mollisiaceae sp. DMI_Dod_QoI]|nr:hypothetical protein EG329_004045 [Helotiales sp. DMI_Dod_QoI]